MSWFEEATTPITDVSLSDMRSAFNGGSTPGSNRFVKKLDNGVDFAVANDTVYGVMTTDQPQGGAGRVVIAGIVPVVVGTGGVDAGAPVYPTAGGACTKTAGTGPAAGVAVYDAVAGQVVPVKLALVAADKSGA